MAPGSSGEGSYKYSFPFYLKPRLKRHPFLFGRYNLQLKKNDRRKFFFKLEDSDKGKRYSVKRDPVSLKKIINK